MRDLFKVFNRHYSAVDVNDTPVSNNANSNSAEENLNYLQQIDFNERNRQKSLKASRSMKQGFTIVDSFFNQRKGGKRSPKCKIIITIFLCEKKNLFFSVLLFSLHWIYYKFYFLCFDYYERQ